MSSTHNFNPADQNEPDPVSPVSPAPPPVQSVTEALNEIDRLLHQMLLLAELSASNSSVSVDRESLQAVLQRLQAKIDRIADRMDSADG